MSKHNRGMGFRDLEVFNLTLLAKQGWHLTQFPYSLIGKILREKYFPNGTFWQAQLGRRSTYAWWSIFNARAVLEGGLVWRVENGEHIKIWGNKWLLSLSTYEV
jgi:hypothetical protein